MGISQNKFGAEVLVSGSYVSSLEHGRFSVGAVLAHRIIQAFREPMDEYGITAEDLLKPNDEDQESEKTE